MSTFPYDFPDEEPTPKRNPSSNNLVWNIFSGLLLIATAIMAVLFLAIFINPQSVFNPLPPPTLPSQAVTITPTPTPGNVLPPTWTPEPSHTPLPTKTEAPTPTASPTKNPPPTEEIPSSEDNKRPESGEVGYDEEGRPILSGPVSLLDTEHFRIHYALSGQDAVTFTEAGNGQLPAYVNQLAEALEYVWQVEIEQFGWAAPPPDGGIGGDDRYDIYLQDILGDGTFGYTDGGEEHYRHPRQNGDNPNTTVVETRAVASYIVLDNDYQGWEEYTRENYETLDLMRTTVAHEFNHAIQFGYDGIEPADWLWEATATWMQDEVYDHIDDGIEDVYTVAKSPDTCQLAFGGETRVEDENHWYGEWIFIRYISEHYGHETVRAIWEEAAQLDGYEAVEAALAGAGTSLDETFRGFSVSLLTRAFEEGANYPLVRLEGEVSSGGIFTPADGVGQMAADYVEIISPAPVQVTVYAANLGGILVGVVGDEAQVFPMDGNRAILNAGQFDHLFLLAINLSRAESEEDCQKSAYTVDVRTVSQAENPGPAAIYPSPNFQAPEVEGLLDPEEYWGENWQEGSADSVDPPAELIPAYLPSGYEFVDAYEVSASQYGEDAIWYIPGGGTALEIDFYGPGQEDVVAITASDSPYTSLDEWTAEANFEPYPVEIKTIEGVTVIIEDYTDEEGPYSFATFLQDGQFIVVEGNISVEEMVKVVENLVT